MNASTITVHWHNDNQPIYSVDFQPNSRDESGVSGRLVTGGGDNNIRVWKVHHNHVDSKQGDDPNSPQNTSVEYLSTLRKHTQAVNVVRFNSTGEILATAGDDGTLILWKLADRILKGFETEEEEDDELQESWQAICQFRSSTSEINDICWSPSSEYIVTGSMDNIMRVYKVDINNKKLGGHLVTSIKNHNHYIQGVYWDPLDEFVVSQSADRSVNVYTIVKHKKKDEVEDIKLVHKFTKVNNQYLYHSETLQSFFRRLCFSPDGSLVLTPAGLETSQTTESATKLNNGSNDDTVQNTVYVYSRSSLLHTPILKISNLNKPAIAVAFNPNLYEVTKSAHSITNLAYKMVFAIATQDSVIVYDTETFSPLGFVSNLHYSSITDLKWDVDGSKIIVSSTDGFCSIISFDEALFGTIHKKITDFKSEIEIESEIETKGGDKIKKEPQTNDINDDDNMDIDQEEDKTEPPEITSSPKAKSATTSPKKPEVEAVPSPNKVTIDSFFNKSKESTSSPIKAAKNDSKRRIVPTLIE
ncbi:WD40-repeat-containing domain protein [Scheffersomyces xylosifermentans]|uniref:WD40-repeat-containing domain protein n=1 Tax=Scheffersomyces xylosifermentans TaxID=1304137 RepID=UPI00315D1454